MWYEKDVSWWVISIKIITGDGWKSWVFSISMIPWCQCWFWEDHHRWGSAKPCDFSEKKSSLQQKPCRFCGGFSSEINRGRRWSFVRIFTGYPSHHHHQGHLCKFPESCISNITIISSISLITSFALRLVSLFALRQKTSIYIVSESYSTKLVVSESYSTKLVLFR